MTTLALEFSSEQRSVALARDGKVLAEAMETGGYRATNAFGLIGKVLTDASVSRDEVEVIAVGVGPGSYTGIRAAIAVAQGWRLARKVNLLGISSAESLAAQAQAQKIFGRINVVIDAQRNEFYLTQIEISETSRRELVPLTIVAATEIAARKAGGEVCLGPEMDPALFPTAAAAAKLAAQQTIFVPAEKLEPIYLRETSFIKAPASRVI